MEKFTKIVATLGPSTDSVDVIRSLYKAGMNVARLNFSHGDYDYFEKLISNIREVSNEIAILLDTKGPEIRTGKIESGEIILKENQELILTKKDVLGNEKMIHINYAKLEKVSVGNKVLIDDGLIECEVVEVSNDELLVKVLNGGILGSRKTVSIWGHNVEIPFLSEKDVEDIKFGIKHNIDYIAASFVRNAQEVLELKEFLLKNDSNIRIISKIEHADAVKNIDEIISASSAIMVARGDLGVEMPLEAVPKVQMEIIEKCNYFGKPVIVATQMLESMKINPRPTRAEVSDVASAILQGADAVMLSGETASGKYPVKAVAVMTKIAKNYDMDVVSKLSENSFGNLAKFKYPISTFVTLSASVAAKTLNAKAIITPTESGFTARKVARFKSKCPIYALTRNYTVLRQLQLSRGVFPVYFEFDCDKEICGYDQMIEKLVIDKYNTKEFGENDIIVITAGHIKLKQGNTNMLEVYKISDFLTNN